jgi:hypothetical protein
MWPTIVDVEPSGSLLLVENGLRRLVRGSSPQLPWRRTQPVTSA